ncbi:hypothetical protein LHEJCM1062_18400 [Lactobacillus helveticus]|uniref:Uncharacterized protein n=1 Tax=Lactobacillus helveticus TaxID=1587 RepID=A0AAV4E8I2_LACHE|nr:hypothetical protein LHEJCM1007_03810 [Lactobacillus helveticus]GFP13968.1 hypothetical protein LHEJCM1062_18400 [Lactobacillus helveticus]
MVFTVKRLAVAKTAAAKYVTLLVLILFIEKNPPIYIINKIFIFTIISSGTIANSNRPLF